MIVEACLQWAVAHCSSTSQLMEGFPSYELSATTFLAGHSEVVVRRQIPYLDRGILVSFGGLPLNRLKSGLPLPICTLHFEVIRVQVRLE
jgi:hypothetical protein